MKFENDSWDPFPLPEPRRFCLILLGLPKRAEVETKNVTERLEGLELLEEAALIRQGRPAVVKCLLKDCEASVTIGPPEAGTVRTTYTAMPEACEY